ncbi:MAG TPA: hypothetical protein VMG82_03965 [Candidatus Sulfotelmatobacter sp.]|nr:hypothetical protein [Candidatus Sulfotelmatobacter sp.]
MPLVSSTLPDGSNTAACPARASVIVPAAVKVKDAESNNSAVLLGLSVVATACDQHFPIRQQSCSVERARLLHRCRWRESAGCRVINVTGIALSSRLVRYVWIPATPRLTAVISHPDNASEYIVNLLLT